MMGKLIQESGESYSRSTVLYINTVWGHVSMELNCVQTTRKSKVYVHGTTIRSQNAEQLRENGWLRCSRKPQSFKTYDSSEFGVWSLREPKAQEEIEIASQTLNQLRTSQERSFNGDQICAPITRIEPATDPLLRPTQRLQRRWGISFGRFKAV